jgi:hypothetical protein
VTVAITSLARSREYLARQRRAIIARAITGALVSAVPIPLLDDWIVGVVLGGGYRRIAAAHHVDLDAQALQALVHGATPPASLAEMAIGGVALRLAGRAARKVMVAMATIDRARSASRTFVTMTLFDHYCARLHTGLALDARAALVLREEIARSIEQTPGALSFHPFRRGALSAVRATLRAPLQLADLASRGALRRLLAKRNDITEAEAVDELDQAVETALASQNGFLSRTVAAVELQLSAEVNPFLDQAIDALDRRWRARVAAGLV